MEKDKKYTFRAKPEMERKMLWLSKRLKIDPSKVARVGIREMFRQQGGKEQ